MMVNMNRGVEQGSEPRGPARLRAHFFRFSDFGAGLNLPFRFHFSSPGSLTSRQRMCPGG